MKKLFRISAAIVAALVSLAACQKADEVENQAPKLTHSVKFTTDLSTKTSYVIEGTEVKYKWENEDLNRLHVYEDGMEGTINIGESDIDKNYVLLTVNFEGSGEGSHTYTANLNEGIVKSNQVADGKYDSDCDVLVAKPVSSEEITDEGIYTFQFRRPVAITELKLKNLTADEEVSKVTILSDADHPLVGKYTQGADDYTTGTWSETSNKITVTFGEGETKTVESDGSLVVPIVSKPLENASVKVLVKTENGLKYRKVTSPALTLTANNVKVQGIGMTQVTEAEHAEDGWYLVTDASELFDGDEIRIACTSKDKMAGDFAVTDKGPQVYLKDCTVSFNNNNKLTGVTPDDLPLTFTLSEAFDTWNISTASGVLGATAAKALAYDDGTLDWGIGIAESGVATISSATSDYGYIQYNSSAPRFLNYASGQTDIQIFKKYGDASDPIMKTARTASFSPEAATVTIDANNNVFPELSFNPTDATDGEQTWTSSKPDVATVNETTGEVTLVSDGTTTISVEIAETDTYQPCSASYVLTVKPAEVEGVDYLDREWTGNTSSSYAEWDKSGSSTGNTYAGYSAGGNSAIQLKSSDSVSGIVVTNSASNQVARKITVDWESHTSSGRTLDIYGKSTAYSGASGLYSNDTQGTKLGSIVYGTSTELEITGDYEYIGIRSNSGALYLNWIKIQWEDAKPEYNLSFWDNMAEETITEYYATVETPGVSSVANIILCKDGNPVIASSYESSNTDVATVNEVSGAVTLKKKGSAVITATLNGDDTHKTTKVSYTIHVANKLSSIKLADDSEQPTTFYVGQDFSFTGIKVEATYSDGEKKTLTADDLTNDNFSGFDSSAAVESQTITVSYTDGATETTTYNVEIKPLVTLYKITVPAEDANGNSITVKGGLTEAPEGAEIELNVNLNTEKGYKLTSLKLNEVEHSGDVAEGKYTFAMPAKAVTVTAEFDNHYTVTLTQPAANGTVKVKGETTSSLSIACGETVSVLAEPATGYELDSWTINGAELADATKASTTFTMPANDVTITASFKVKLNETTVTFSSLGYTSWGKDGQFSGTTYDELSQKQNPVTFTYTRGSGSTYANQSSIRFYKDNKLTFSVPDGCKITSIEWTGSDLKNDVTTNVGTCTSTTEVLSWSGNAQSVTFTRPSTASSYATLSSVTVKYVGTPTGGDTPTTYTLTLTQVTGGTITAEVDGQSVSTGAKIEEGKTVTIKAEASSGYSFTSWALPSSGLSSSTSATATFTMTADTEVKANFTENGGGGTDPKEYTYTFSSKSWGDATSSWTSGKDGNGYTANQGVQVTSGVTGANATSKSSFTNVSKIVVNYCTNASKGKGTISVKVGNGTAKSYSVSAPSSGGTTLRNTDDFVFSTHESGTVNITVECGTNSIYINSITITAD